MLNAESARVITRPHIPGGKARIRDLIKRVSGLSDEDVQHLLEAVIQDFSGRHRNFRETLQRNFDRIAAHAPKRLSLSSEKQLLLGSYVTAEYSVEAAALFNPSIVPHPDQKGVEKGSLRFVMSFRATGEGHLSSIEFRSGIVDENDDILFDPVSQYVATPKMHTDPVYSCLHFRRKIDEICAHERAMNHLLDGLKETFTFDEL
ncbi:MAG: glycosidase, partial [Gammaproteobacteria bacterium]|nr:glycosidase [Gammaproteobacteria bacterium]